MGMGFLPVIAAVILVLPIYGQKTTSEEHRDQEATETQQKQLSHPTGVSDKHKPAANAQEQGHTKQPDGYFDALVSANNVPNVVLSLVGIVGIVVALRTLNWLKTQTRAIERQVDLTEPRLHIDAVRAANFEDGQSPVFFVRVINSGIIAAENVTIGMEAAIEPGKIVRYQKDQVIAIPADGSRECFIHSEMVLDQHRLAAYDNGDIPLRISGYVKWSGKTAQYCYKYNPWPSGNRPQGVPVFVPCDFETGVNTAIKIEAVMPTMSAGLSAVKNEGHREEPST